MPDKNVARECNFCSDVFRSSIVLNRHLVESHEPICPICSQKYQNFKNLKAHIRLYHSKDSVIPCDICGKICKNKNAYAQHHYHVHKRGQQLKCNICGRICVNKTRLIRHTRACLINNQYQLPQTQSEAFDEDDKVANTFNDSIKVPVIKEEKEYNSEKHNDQIREVSNNEDFNVKETDDSCLKSTKASKPENQSKELLFLSEKEVSLDLDNSPAIHNNDSDSDHPEITLLEESSKEDNCIKNVQNSMDTEQEDADDFLASIKSSDTTKLGEEQRTEVQVLSDKEVSVNNDKSNITETEMFPQEETSNEAPHRSIDDEVKLEPLEPIETDRCPECLAKVNNMERHMKMRHFKKSSSVKAEKMDECPDCKIRVKSLKKHIERKHGEKISAKCTECEKKFDSQSNLKAHMSVMHSKIQYSCHVCGDILSCKTYLNRHIRDVHEAEILNCDKCFKSYSGKTKLYQHMIAAHSDCSFECDICGNVFSSKKYLNCHIKKVHESNERLVCQHCSKHYSGKTRLYHHIRAVHRENASKCQDCGKNYKNLDLLNKHRRLYHNPKNIPV